MRLSATCLAIVSLVLALGCSRTAAVGTAAPEEPTAEPKGDLTVTPGARDVPMFGGTLHRNMANTAEKDIPASFSVAKGKEQKVKWSVPLGDHAYGGPVISGGRIFVGTNNEKPRDPAITGDKGVVMCFRESDGTFLWQIVHDKLPDPEVNDASFQGVISTPVVEGNRLYYVSNRCEVVCADVEGLANGNQGVTDEKYKGKAGGDVLWSLDMIKDLGVFPNQASACSPLIIGDLVFVVTGNGTDPGTQKLPSPKAPSFLAVHKETGKVVWQDASPGTKILEGQWSNPAAAKVKDRWLVFFPGGDGWVYAFEAETGKLVWKFDCNPKKAVYKSGGRGDRAYLVATPAVWEDKLYIATGMDPTAGPGVGHLWCIDITKEPAGPDKDVSPRDDNFDPKAPVNKDSALVWHLGGEIKPLPDEGREWYFSRTISTVAVHDGVVYAAELMGFVQCLDAKTGKKYWEHDMLDSTWCSPYYVDGKVFQGTDSGYLFVFAPGKEKKLLHKFDMRRGVQVPPVACNGVLYVNTGDTLFAIADK